MGFRKRGLSNIVAGIILAIVTASALTIIVQWTRTQVSRMSTKVAEGVAVAPHRVGSDLIIVNYGSSSYIARLVNEDGDVCNDSPTVQLPPRSTEVVTTSCSVRWVEVNSNLLRVVRVAGG